MIKSMKGKPLDSGFKRTMKIVVGAIGLGVLTIAGFHFMGSEREDPVIASDVSVGALRGEKVMNPELSEATKRRLARAQEKEAQAARREGRTYIPETIIAGGVPIEISVPAAPTAQGAVEVRRPGGSVGQQAQGAGQSDYAQYQATQNEYRQLIADGMRRQLEAMMVSLGPATIQDVAIEVIEPQPYDEGLFGSGSSDSAFENSNIYDKSNLIVGGNEIIAAEVITPIDTDKTRFVLARITSGKAAGATLRGEVLPMSTTGDIEDIGIRFSSMRLENGDFYQVDAIALNEATATDAMDGKVDRRIFTRHVMPVLTAGLSGLSTYFTVRGTPATKIDLESSGDRGTIVEQDKASRREAREQGIGDAVDRATTNLENEVNRLGNRPNQVTLDAYTPIGVIFNAPVYRDTQG